jgi:hypothetical protein
MNLNNIFACDNFEEEIHFILCIHNFAIDTITGSSVVDFDVIDVTVEHWEILCISLTWWICETD